MRKISMWMSAAILILSGLATASCSSFDNAAFETKEKYFITHIYADNGGLKTENIDYVYDAQGRVVQETSDGTLVGNPFTMLVKYTYEDGAITRYEPDENFSCHYTLNSKGMVVSIDYLSESGEDTHDTYEYDAQGHLIAYVVDGTPYYSNGRVMIL